MERLLPPSRRRLARRGSTLLETCAALALCSAAALAAVSGVRPLVCAARVETARSALLDALLEARRRAYTEERSVAAEVKPGTGSVVLEPPGSTRSLGDDVTITSAPADGSVDFRATGLADNATVTVACAASTASVVVNQRGVVR